MSLWRFGRGWSNEEMARYLKALKARKPNFSTPLAQMTPENGWTSDGAETVIGREPPGPPIRDGLFARCRAAIVNYDFSDPKIVTGHFDQGGPLTGRDMLLEIRVLGFRFLNGVRIHSMRDERHDDMSVFGFRYDTLEGHIESGFEWFLLTKDHVSGDIAFKIEATWRLGQFPNWWSRLGFLIIGERYRERWRHRAPEILKTLTRNPDEQATYEPQNGATILFANERQAHIASNDGA